MNLHFLNSKEKKKLFVQLNEQFGIQELPYAFLESGKEKIRAFSGNISGQEIQEIALAAPIELIGLYIIKKENNELRLSFDAALLLKEQIKKNILDINEEQYEKWMRGSDLDIEVKQGIYAIKHENDFLGCGKSNGKKILNYVPKNKRLK